MRMLSRSRKAAMRCAEGWNWVSAAICGGDDANEESASGNDVDGVVGVEGPRKREGALRGVRRFVTRVAGDGGGGVAGPDVLSDTVDGRSIGGGAGAIPAGANGVCGQSSKSCASNAAYRCCSESRNAGDAFVASSMVLPLQGRTWCGCEHMSMCARRRALLRKLPWQSASTIGAAARTAVHVSIQ